MLSKREADKWESTVELSKFNGALTVTEIDRQSSGPSGYEVLLVIKRYRHQYVSEWSGHKSLSDIGVWLVSERTEWAIQNTLLRGDETDSQRIIIQLLLALRKEAGL